MSTVTAKEVNELRQKTGAGIMDCKKALTESEGDFEKAIDYLRKKGQKVSALRAGKEAKEGVVIAKTSEDKKRGVIVQLSCETDFVAKNSEFVAFAQSITELAVNNNPADLNELLQLKLNGVTVQDKVNEQVGVINENIQVLNYESVTGETVVAYNHAGNRIGVLVSLNQPLSDSAEETAKGIAMQIAAMNPVAVDRDFVSQEVVDRELAIGREQAQAEGKPEAMLDKIAQGKLQKFFKESTLVNQDYVRDSSKTVKDILAGIDAKLQINDFKRVALGA